MKNLSKRIAVFTALIFVLISCAPAPTPLSTPTNAPSKTPQPSATPTLTPAPTATATPTPSPSQIAESLGLPVEVKLNETFSYFHKYRVDGEYLRNDYNNTIAAVKENGVWRALGESQEDRNLKYGALADSLGMEVVENYDGVRSTWDGITYYKSLDMNVVYTGEPEYVNMFFPNTGTTIRDIRGKVVYRMGDGQVVENWVSLASPEASGGILSLAKLSNGGSSVKGEWIPSEDDFLSRLTPGQKWSLKLIYEGVPTMSANSCDGVHQCLDEQNKQKYLWMQENEKIVAFCKSWIENKGEVSKAPLDLLVPTWWSIY